MMTQMSLIAELETLDREVLESSGFKRSPVLVRRFSNVDLEAAHDLGIRSSNTVPRPTP